MKIKNQINLPPIPYLSLTLVAVQERELQNCRKATHSRRFIYDEKYSNPTLKGKYTYYTNIQCFYQILCFLKNITLADNLKNMGYKIKFHALLFRFRPTGILGNDTISQV